MPRLSHCSLTSSRANTGCNFSPSFLQKRGNKENEQVLGKETWLNPFWQPIKDYKAKCFLMLRAEEPVLSGPSINQGLHLARGRLSVLQ